MKMQRLPSSAALLILALVGCGGTAPASAPPASSPAAKPAGSQGPAAWQQAVDAAKKEGTVAVFGPDGNDMRDVLTAGFEKEFGIKIEYMGDPGPGIPPRINAERGAGKFLWDVIVTGTSTGLTALVPGKVLDPMEPALNQPDVKDPKTWRGGQMEFLDPDKSLLVMSRPQ